MDFELELDEREKDNIMTLVLDEITLEIPEELIKEREKLMHFPSRKKNIEHIKYEHNIFLDYFLEKHNQDLTKYNQEFINYLNGQIEWFRPQN